MSKQAENLSAAAAVVFSGDLLRDAALSSGTLRNYKKNFTWFLEHEGFTLRRFLDLPAERVDQALCNFINFLFASGKNKTYANQAFYGAVHIRPDLRVRLALPRSQQSLRGFHRLQASVPHPPLTWELTVAIAVTLARSGYHGHAFAMLLAFDCYLRVGEFTRLRCSDVAFPQDARMGSAHRHTLLRLRVTKTGKEQSVTVRDPAVVALLHIWVAHVSREGHGRPDGFLFQFTAEHFRRHMHRAAEVLGVGHVGYVVHSLRHGGATRDHMEGMLLADVMARGRWAAHKSALHYIQKGPAYLAALNTPQLIHDLGRACDAELVAVFAFLITSVPECKMARRVRFA
jgi:integrase